MTPAQRDQLRRLGHCVMFPGGWDKRFVRDLSARPDDYELTERQAAALGRLMHRYRRQLGGPSQAPIP